MTDQPPTFDIGDVFPKLEIHHDPTGEWAALYVNGKLDRVGDAYLSTERVFEIFGVRVTYDGSFLRGQNEREGVAPTLEDVDAYRAEQERKRAQAQELRVQAARLLAEADGLEGSR